MKTQKTYNNIIIIVIFIILISLLLILNTKLFNFSFGLYTKYFNILLGIIILFSIWIISNFIWAKNTGWLNLYTQLAIYKSNNSNYSNIKKIKTSLCYINNTCFQGVSCYYNPEGIVLKMHPIFRLGFPPLYIKWSEILTIVIQKSPLPNFSTSIMKRFYSREGHIYAYLKLKKFPDYILIIPWKDNFIKVIPTSVKMEFRNELSNI